MTLPGLLVTTSIATAMPTIVALSNKANNDDHRHLFALASEVTAGLVNRVDVDVDCVDFILMSRACRAAQCERRTEKAHHVRAHAHRVAWPYFPCKDIDGWLLEKIPYCAYSTLDPHVLASSQIPGICCCIVFLFLHFGLPLLYTVIPFPYVSILLGYLPVRIIPDATLHP